MAILNADGVNVATVTALLLNLKLEATGYYHSCNDADLPYSEVLLFNRIFHLFLYD